VRHAGSREVSRRVGTDRNAGRANRSVRREADSREIGELHGAAQRECVRLPATGRQFDAEVPSHTESGRRRPPDVVGQEAEFAKLLRQQRRLSDAAQ